MEIDQFKNLWKEDSEENLPEISLSRKKLLISPLQKIRKNMRMEFLSSVFFLPLLIWFITRYISQPVTQFYALMLLCVGYVVIAYYYLKFYRLYQQIDHLEWSTTHSLLKLKYDLLLNVQMYKSYYLAFIPILFCEMILVFQDLDFRINIGFKPLIFNFLFWFAASCISLYYTGKAWLYYFYDKYIIRISAQIDQLTSEAEPEPVRPQFFQGSLFFLQKHFKPSTAYLLHLFIWFWICILVLSLIYLSTLMLFLTA